MAKGKLQKFADMREYSNVVEHPYSIADNIEFPLAGNWKKEFFGNDNPIVLELGCGRGEYTVALARRYPEKNFIGRDKNKALQLIERASKAFDSTPQTCTTR